MSASQLLLSPKSPVRDDEEEVSSEGTEGGKSQPEAEPEARPESEAEPEARPEVEAQDSAQNKAQDDAAASQGGGTSSSVVTANFDPHNEKNRGGNPCDFGECLPEGRMSFGHASVVAEFDDQRVLLKLLHRETNKSAPKMLSAVRFGGKRPAHTEPTAELTRGEVLWRYANTLANENDVLRKRLKVMQNTVRLLVDANPTTQTPNQVAISTSPNVQVSAVASTHPNALVPPGAPTELVASEASSTVGAVPDVPAFPFLSTKPTEMVKPLPDELRQRIEDEYELTMRQDLWDIDGNAFVPGGDHNATLCGAFPHGIFGPRPGSSDRPKAFVCADKQVVINVSIRKKTDRNNKSITEQSLLTLLRNSTPREEQQKWTTYDAKIVLFLEMRFYNETDPDGDSSKIWASEPKDDKGPPCSFATPPRNGHLLVPKESSPYQHDPHYELSMEGGNATFAFHINKGVFESALSSNNKNARFVFRVKCLTPSLSSLEGFSLTSMPFHARASFGRMLTRDEYYIRGANAGDPSVVCPRSRVPVKAACPRRN